MNFFEGMVQGAANQATGILNQQMQDEAQLNKQQALAQFNAELEDKKMRVRLALEQEYRDAPLKRISSKAKEFANQEVPMEAAPVTDLSATPGAAGLDTGGMRGNYAELQAKAKDLPEEYRQPYLDQLKRQFDSDTETAKVGILGQTRKRTADEALNAAADYAKVNDPVAYAAYQREIGKPLRDERRADKEDRDADIREKKNDAEAADRKRRADWLQTHQTEALELQREIARTNAQRGGADVKDPAAVSTAKWLAANKDDPVMMDAWEKANQTKSKDVKGIAADLMSKDPMLSAAEAVTKARELVEASDAPKNGADKPITQAEYAKLPSGSIFTAPDGSKRRKP